MRPERTRLAPASCRAVHDRGNIMAGTRKKKISAEARDEQRLARRMTIIDAAERVFATKPFPRVSMRDVAKEAGISPALIYRHFPDQQHLFAEAFLRGSQRLIRRFRELGTEHHKASLEETTDIFITYLTEHENYFKMMTHFMLEGNLQETLLDKINSAERSLLDQFDSLFSTQCAPSNTRMLSYCFFAALNGILITFRRHPGRSPEELKRHMDDIGRVMARLFINAIRCKDPDLFG
ncbi:MAG TPA: TetR/AcrR family transcriptional regulator [Deltaproteobacteria bacterium]|nr:TetR/AcrR family transcriptional regulator [Deltaproteobacteria bacterium]